jgi:spore maturation protein CgeB
MADGAGMNIAIFGLAVSSTWGNGHAALWRGLIGALTAQGHAVIFFERDVPYYAANRDLHELTAPSRLVLYADWAEVRPDAARALAEADVGIVTSYCPDAIAAGALLLDSRAALRCFYDLDTPVTLDRLRRGERVDYLPEAGLADFDLTLSYTGGPALDALRRVLGARRVVPLYGSVDPAQYRPVSPIPRYRAALSYIGTYAADRQAALERLLVAPARAREAARFVIAGAQYPQEFPWSENIWFVRHLPPVEHPAFYSSSRLTLNVTRAAMARMGWCPSGRLFEAAACGTAILSDAWDGLAAFFVPGEEILVASDTEDALAALDLSDVEIARIARRGRERALAEHSAARRAAQMLDAFAMAEA